MGNRLIVRRDGGLMVSALDSGVSAPGSSPGGGRRVLDPCLGIGVPLRV